MPLNRLYASLSELPRVAPVFPLSGVLLLPRGELPLNIFEPRYVAMIDDAMKGDRMIGMIQPLLASGDHGQRPDLEQVGCLGRITQLAETGDGRYILNLTGVIRFRTIEEMPSIRPYRQCRIDLDEFQDDLSMASGGMAVDRTYLIKTLRAFAEAKKLNVEWSAIDSATTEQIVNTFAMMGPFSSADKQALLEAFDFSSRADRLLAAAGIAGTGAKPGSSRLD